MALKYLPPDQRPSNYGMVGAQPKDYLEMSPNQWREYNDWRKDKPAGFYSGSVVNPYQPPNSPQSNTVGGQSLNTPYQPPNIGFQSAPPLYSSSQQSTNPIGRQQTPINSRSNMGQLKDIYNSYRSENYKPQFNRKRNSQFSIFNQISSTNTQNNIPQPWIYGNTSNAGLQPKYFPPIVGIFRPPTF